MEIIKLTKFQLGLTVIGLVAVFGVKALPTDQYDSTLPSLYMAIEGTGEVTKARRSTKTDEEDWDDVTVITAGNRDVI